MIRVLVVEDSPLMCKILTSILNRDPEILVVSGCDQREGGGGTGALPQTGYHHHGH